MKTLLKKMLLGTGTRGRRVPFGLYKGLVLSINPAVDASFYFGLYEAETAPWLRRAILQCKSLVDVGTGCGELAVWGLSFPHVSRVLAYDSGSERWASFYENVRLNDFQGDPRLTAVQGPFLGSGRTGDAEKLLAVLPEPILFKIDIDAGRKLFYPACFRFFAESGAC